MYLFYLENVYFCICLYSVQHIRESLGTSRVAFFGRVLQEVNSYTNPYTIVFDDTKTNIGDAFNPTLGIFTAPTDGVYVFSVTIQTVSVGYGFIYVHKNHDIISGLMYATDSFKSPQSTTETIVLELRQGDIVYVEISSTGSSLIPRSGFSTFAGFLLWETAPVEIIVGK